MVDILCRLCGERTVTLVHKKIGRFYQCQCCGFIFKDKRDYITEEVEFHIYEQHNNCLEDNRYVQYFREFIEHAVLPYCPSEKKGLDFGSGPVPVLAPILEKEYGYTMDIYDKFYAKEKVYQGKEYALITSTEVIEHLSNPMAYFQLFKTLLKPRGTLAIMTQFYTSVDYNFIGWHYMRDRSHISFYTPESIDYIGRCVGLKRIYTDEKKYITLTHV